MRRQKKVADALTARTIEVRLFRSLAKRVRMVGDNEITMGAAYRYDGAYVTSDKRLNEAARKLENAARYIRSRRWRVGLIGMEDAR